MGETNRARVSCVREKSTVVLPPHAHKVVGEISWRKGKLTEKVLYDTGLQDAQNYNVRLGEY